MCIKEGSFEPEEDVMDYFCDDYIQEIKDDIAQNHAKDCQNKGYTVLNLQPASIKYNCHSYAWHSQDVLSNNIWLNSPEVYYSETDASYELVDVANGEEPRIGDIIVYMSWNGSPNHSGIIVGYSEDMSGGYTGNANKYIVDSKWGDAGLYRHRGDHCGYYETATSIKYYRLRTDGASEMSVSNFNFTDSKTITSRSDIATNGGSKAATYSMYELNVNESGEYTITISASSPLTISFLDVNRNNFSVTPTITEGNTYVYQFDKYFDEGYYYVRAQFASADANETITTTVTHKHNYEIYESISDTQHVKKCVCGAIGETHSHVIKADGLPKRYKPCMYCGHLIDTESGIIIPSIKNRIA